MHPIPPNTTDILHPLLLAALLVLIVADRGEKEPNRLRYPRAALLFIVSIAIFGVWASGLRWNVSKQIGEPVDSGATMITGAVAVLLVIKAVRKPRPAAAGRPIETASGTEGVGEDVF